MIFEVTADHIANLSDTNLRILVGKLAEHEVWKAGCSPCAVTYGGHQNASDGGIDVHVDAGNGAVNGFVPRSMTGFQVKAEDFSASKITKEMRPGGILRPSIVELGTSAGAYIIVSSKGSVAKSALDRRKNAMRAAIEAQVPGLFVDFYDRQRLATWVNLNPGLVPWVRSKVGIPLSGWQPFDDWSSSPDGLEDEYFADEHVRLVGVRLKDSVPLEATDGLNALRAILQQPGSVVRLVGLSGVGKTRFVQALFDDRIGENALSRGSAIYTDMSLSPSPTPQDLLEHIVNLNQDATLVVDNCGVELHRMLANRLSKSSGKVSIVTVEYDVSDDEPENTDTFKLEPSSKDLIEKILQRKFPTLSGPEVSTIANFSEGNSRVAIALGSTSTNGESLANLKDNDLVNRLILQRNDADRNLFAAAKACSLVYSFDSELMEGDDAELPLLAELVDQSVAEFCSHIGELYRRQLIQKRSKWRAFLPHALAHKLAKQALQDIPKAKIHNLLFERANGRLLKSFSKRIGCLHDSDEAMLLIDSWFAEGGAFSDITQLNPIGMIVLSNIAPVSPARALGVLKREILADPSNENIQFNANELGSLLRAIAYDGEHFEDAADCLVALCNGKVESNNTGDAHQVFKSLFFACLSGTCATENQRADYLLKLAQSDIPYAKQLVIGALDAMLKSSHFSSSYSFEFGARKRNYGYYPSTSEEVCEWFETGVSLSQTLHSFPQYREAIRELIANELKYLCLNVRDVQIVVDLVREFAQEDGWPEAWIAIRRSSRRAKKKKLYEIAQRLDDLAAEFAPTNLSERISTYVLPEEYSLQDIAQIDFDDDKRFEKARKHVAEECKKIGVELSVDLTALSEILPMLYSVRHGRTQIVAAAIAENSDDPEAMFEMLKDYLPQDEPSHGAQIMLCGYLSGLKQNSVEIAEEIVSANSFDPKFYPYIVSMHISAGITPDGASRLLKLAGIKDIPSHSFRALGYWPEEIANDAFCSVMKIISEREDGFYIAIDAFHSRFYSKKSDGVPLSEIERSVAKELLLRTEFNGRRQDRLGYELAEIANLCLEEEDGEIGKEICAKLSRALSAHRVYAWDFTRLLGILAQKFPHIFMDALLLEGSSREYWRRKLFQEARDNAPCPLNNIPNSEIIAWANLDPEDRFIRIAGSIRPFRNIDPIEEQHPSDSDTGTIEWTDTAIEILEHSPDAENVLRAFADTFEPDGGWVGSQANVFERRARLLDELGDKFDGKYADMARRIKAEVFERIESVRAMEERITRERDEQFEW